MKQAEAVEATAQFSILAIAQWMCGKGPKARGAEPTKVDVHMSIVTGDVLGLEKASDATCMVLCVYTEDVATWKQTMQQESLLSLYEAVMREQPKIVETSGTEQ